MDDDESPWYRPVLAGIGAMLGVALLVGAVISVVTLGAVNITGLSGSDGPSQEPSLYMPTGDPTPAQDEGVTLKERDGSTTPKASEKPEKKAEPKQGEKEKRKKPRKVISLSASPLEVAPMERIYLSGTYPGREGASLQVQRSQGGGWRDFPTSATVSGGSFSTYVMTGQAGKNEFRMLDPSTGKKSNTVTVTVR